jgi:branched-subunit amino acid transport protein AzlD
MHSIWIIVVAALVTAATRFLPFLIFGSGKKTPDLIVYLGKVLPYAIMGMLVVYCFKDVNFLAPPYGFAELLGCVVVAVLHIWKRNTLLSIGVGTVFYMLLVQLVF